MNKCLSAFAILGLVFFSSINNQSFAFQSSNDVVNKCQSVQDANARLLCYDKIFKLNNTPNIAEDATESAEQVNTEQPAQKASVNLSVAPSANLQSNDKLASPKQINNKKEADFGAEQIDKDDNDKTLQQITTTVTKIKKSLRGKRTIELSNGQIWVERETSRLKLKEGVQVEIKKGALGAYYLNRTDQNRKMRVKRLK